MKIEKEDNTHNDEIIAENIIGEFEEEELSANKKIYKTLSIRKYIIENLKKTNANISYLFRTFINESSNEELKKYHPSVRVAFRIGDKELLKLARTNPKNLSGFIEQKSFLYLLNDKNIEKLNFKHLEPKKLKEEVTINFYGRGNEETPFFKIRASKDDAKRIIENNKILYLGEIEAEIEGEQQEISEYYPD